MPRHLRVFLCHASQDKPAVRKLYTALNSESWIDPWLDEEKLLGGQDFDLEIYKATRDADAIIICLSKKSVVREGYVNKEIRRALEIAQEKPEGTIYVIPLRLDDCDPSFAQLKKLHWIDYFTPNAHERLVKSLRSRANALKIKTSDNKINNAFEIKSSPKFNIQSFGIIGIIFIALLAVLFGANYFSQNSPPLPTASVTVTNELINATSTKTLLPSVTPSQNSIISSITPTSIPTSLSNYAIGESITSEKDGMRLMYVPAGEIILGNDNSLESDEKPESHVYLNAFWIDKTEITNGMYALCVTANECNPPANKSSYTRSNYFGNPEFNDFPVIYVSWKDALKYCSWAERRLPTEAEWEKAADETKTYPWGDAGPKPTLLNYDQNAGDTTEVNKYPSGISIYGTLNMAGNVWEWVSSLHQPYPYDENDGRENLGSPGSRVLRGGSWISGNADVRNTNRGRGDSTFTNFSVGFRCAVSETP